MDSSDANKRLKHFSGRPISTTSGAASLPAYQPPAAIGARGAGSSASIARPANGKTSLRLTVKAPPSKLRQATSGTSLPPNPYADDQSESDGTPAPPRRAARATRNPRTVVDPDSDDDMEDAEGEEDEAAGNDGDEDMLENEDSEEDAEGEEDTDEVQASHPPAPVIKSIPGGSKANVTVSVPSEGPLKSVEAKEMDDDDDDDELSELDSQEEEELNPNADEDEDEEDEDEDEDEDEEEEGEEGDEDSDEDDENSRSATPDVAKLTKRQRGAIVEAEGTDLMALSNEALKKKHLTAEEHAMRRAEMARRRKNLSEKKNEEEKMDTINKLLHKQAPKRRTRAEIEAARAAEAGETPLTEQDPNKLDPMFLRWVSSSKGSIICVSEEWQKSPVGEMFRKPSTLPGAYMIEEVS